MSRPHNEIEGSFAYHLRRYRQQYGRSGISQRGLAMLAHVSRHFVADLELSPKLQSSVEPLVRVAVALQHPVEDLIAPEQLLAIRGDIDRRRHLLGGAAELPAGSPPKANGFHLAVAYRSPYLLMALSDGKTILELRQHRVSAGSMLRFRWLIDREVKAYGVDNVIVEADTKTSDYVHSLGIPYKTITFRRSKQALAGTGDAAPPSDPKFFHWLVEAHPKLRRYVKVLPATGRVAVSERWRTSRLIVATLALAASAAAIPTPPQPVVGRPTAAKTAPRRPKA